MKAMRRQDFLDAKQYLHSPVAAQDPLLANSYARDLIKEVQRLQDVLDAAHTLADEWARNQRENDPWYWSDAADELRATLGPAPR